MDKCCHVGPCPSLAFRMVGEGFEETEGQSYWLIQLLNPNTTAQPRRAGNGRWSVA